MYIVVHTGIDSESPSAFLAPGRWSQGPPHPRTPARREYTPWHWEKMGGFWETGAVWDECPRLNWDCPTLGWKIFWKIFSNFSVENAAEKICLGLKKMPTDSVQAWSETDCQIRGGALATSEWYVYYVYIYICSALCIYDICM